MGLFTNGLAQQRPQTMLPGYGNRMPWMQQGMQQGGSMPMQPPMPQGMPMAPPMQAQQPMPPQAMQQMPPMQAQPHPMQPHPMTNMGMAGGAQGVPLPANGYGSQPGAAVTNGMQMHPAAEPMQGGGGMMQHPQAMSGMAPAGDIGGAPIPMNPTRSGPMPTPHGMPSAPTDFLDPRKLPTGGNGGMMRGIGIGF
jgi:hypothetical protein